MVSLFGLMIIGAITQSALSSETAIFRDCRQCPEMVVVPPGEVLMGSPESESHRSVDEGPQIAVTIPRAFAMGRFEITFEEWDACVADGGCGRYQPTDYGWGRGRRPVIFVDTHDIAAYLAWLSRKTGHAYRLPSEAEWEYAARAGSSTSYPWGEAFESAAVSHGYRTMPVGSFPPNAFGLYDMIGNVWEWVGACWQDRPNVAAFSFPCAYVETRGGGLGASASGLRVANRNRQVYDNRSAILGFRVARELIGQ